VATPEFRVIRLHTRYRRDLTAERTREKQRAEKLLESAAIKLSSVVTDLLLAAYLSAHRTMINGCALCAALAVTERD
jgi:hypothetical protein